MATPRSSSAAGSAKPAVTVLMATYNGMPWVPEQVASILAQERVDVTLVVSDDSSTDGTREWLAGLGDARLRVLPTIEPSGSAARNFFRLLRDVDVADNEYVALADQDDTWSPDKLATAVTGLAAHDADGWSCDVMAFF
ncbi:MAG: glycosyltransferase, partial [Salinibacterium sp.]